MQSFISVRTEFEGLHHWPDACPPEDYLQQPHRHLFVVNIELQTTHTDREIEINSFKRWLDSAIEALQMGPPNKQGLADFGTLSCEQLAEQIVMAVTATYGVGRSIKCTVLEDGLLGAGVIQLGS